LKLLQQITNLPVHSMLTLPVILFGHKSVCSKLLFEITIIVGGKDFAGGSPFGINNILHCTQIIGRERSIGQCFCLAGDSITTFTILSDGVLISGIVYATKSDCGTRDGKRAYLKSEKAVRSKPSFLKDKSFTH